MPSEIKK